MSSFKLQLITLTTYTLYFRSICYFQGQKMCISFENKDISMWPLTFWSVTLAWLDQGGDGSSWRRKWKSHTRTCTQTRRQTSPWPLDWRWGQEPQTYCQYQLTSPLLSLSTLPLASLALAILSVSARSVLSCECDVVWSMAAIVLSSDLLLCLSDQTWLHLFQASNLLMLNERNWSDRDKIGRASCRESV